MVDLDNYFHPYIGGRGTEFIDYLAIKHPRTKKRLLTSLPVIFRRV